MSSNKLTILDEVVGLGIKGVWVVLSYAKCFLTVGRRNGHKIAVIKRKVTVFCPIKCIFVPFSKLSIEPAIANEAVGLGIKGLRVVSECVCFLTVREA